MRKQYFKSKAHYREFRKIWAIANNSPRAKSKIIACNEWINNKTSYGTGKCRVTGWISLEQNIIFNVLTNRNFDKGISYKTNTHKLQNCNWFNFDVSLAIATIKKYADVTKNIDNKLGNTVFFNQLEHVHRLLLPFHGTVTVEMLQQVADHLPSLQGLLYNSPYGKKLVRFIKQQKPKTIAEVEKAAIVFAWHHK